MYLLCSCNYWNEVGEGLNLPCMYGMWLWSCLEGVKTLHCILCLQFFEKPAVLDMHSGRIEIKINTVFKCFLNDKDVMEQVLCSVMTDTKKSPCLCYEMFIWERTQWCNSFQPSELTLGAGSERRVSQERKHHQTFCWDKRGHSADVGGHPAPPASLCPLVAPGKPSSSLPTREPLEGAAGNVDSGARVSGMKTQPSEPWATCESEVILVSSLQTVLMLKWCPQHCVITTDGAVRQGALSRGVLALSPTRASIWVFCWYLHL